MYNILNFFDKERTNITINGQDCQCFILKDLETFDDFRGFLKKNSGIYCIQNQVNGKCYIGSAKVLWRRFLFYKNEFVNNRIKKSSKKLLNSVNKYGYVNFKFFVLQVFNSEETELRLLEQEYILKYKNYGKTGYNIRTDTIEYKPLVMTEAIRQIIISKNSGENSKASKLTELQVLEIIDALCNGDSLKILAKKYKVTTTVISNIKRRKTWTCVKITKEQYDKLKIIIDKDARKDIDVEKIKLIKIDILNKIPMNIIAKKFNVGYTYVSGLKYGNIHKNINP